eukprot:3000086-Rhodomonas_salina.3
MGHGLRPQDVHAQAASMWGWTDVLFLMLCDRSDMEMGHGVGIDIPPANGMRCDGIRRQRALLLYVVVLYGALLQGAVLTQRAVPVALQGCLQLIHALANDMVRRNQTREPACSVRNV